MLLATSVLKLVIDIVSISSKLTTCESTSRTSHVTFLGHGNLNCNPRFHSDLELFRSELVRSTKLTSKPLNNEFLGEREGWICGQLEQAFLGQVRVPDATEDPLLLLVSQLDLIGLLLDCQIPIFLFNA